MDFKPLHWKCMGGMLHTATTVRGSFVIQQQNNGFKIYQSVGIDNSVHVRIKHPELHKIDLAKDYCNAVHIELLKEIVEKFHVKPKPKKKERVFPYKHGKSTPKESG